MGIYFMASLCRPVALDILITMGIKNNKNHLEGEDKYFGNSAVALCVCVYARVCVRACVDLCIS